MKEKTLLSPHDHETQKRAWEPPMIEELDFSATEAAYIPGAPVDLGIYTI
jgi:hypothetical protein